MTEKLQQIINRELAKLPIEQKEAITSLDWPSMAEEIGRNHSLTEEEIDSLQVETLLGLLSLTSTDGFITDIEDNVGVTHEEAGNIADELGKKVFYPVILKTEKNIKGNMENRETTVDQNLDFILSGGDYSSFMEKRKLVEPTEDVTKEEIQDNLEKTLGIKDRFVK
jgi:hypothetical protein